MKKTLTAEQRRIRRFANKVLKSVDSSYSIKWRKPYGWPLTTFTWDGSGVLRMSEIEEWKAIHDVAHVLVASKERRKIPEFGLGNDPSGWHLGQAPVTVPNPQHEENRVCDLHWAFAVWLGGAELACAVENYLGIQKTPSKRTIECMKQYPGLPKTFVSRVLKVRKEMLSHR